MSAAWRRGGPRRSVRTVLALASALALALGVAGCASIPTSGPVQSGEDAEPAPPAPLFEFNPSGPRRGAAPEEVVSGFLTALQATPATTKVASEFLTTDAAEGWRPDRATIVYGSQRTVGRGAVVDVQLDDAFRLDFRGRWRGSWEPRGGALTLQLARERGEWRITDPPDAMVVPKGHFQSRYQPYSLYYFDPSGTILVPELVYLARGVQTATQLVSGLLAGPPPGVGEVERSYFPDGLRSGVGVPVGANGVARVVLGEELLGLAPGDLTRAAAQLAWTLRQLPGVAGFQVVVNGNALELPGGGAVADVADFADFDPLVASASPDLFGLRGRDVVQVVGGQEVEATVVPEGLAERIGPPRSVGVNMASQRFAVVGSSGRTVVTLGRASGAEPAVVYSGEDVLKPLWDWAGNLWLVDRRADGAFVVVLTEGRPSATREWRLPRGRVLAVALSRDGTRFVVAQRGARGYELRQFRVVRDGQGRPDRLTPPLSLLGSEPVRQPLAVGWRDPTTAALLIRSTATTTRVLHVPSDGSAEATGFAPAADTLFDRGTAMAVSPGAPAALLVMSRSGTVHALSPQGRWELDAVDVGLRAPTFVG